MSFTTFTIVDSQHCYARDCKMYKNKWLQYDYKHRQKVYGEKTGWKGNKRDT